MHNSHTRCAADDPLCSVPMAAHSHGDAANNSVGVVLPAGASERMGIGPKTELAVRCLRDRALVAPPDRDLAGEPIRVDRRRPVVRGGSLQLNIPAETRRILGIEIGDRVLVRSYRGHVAVVPVSGGVET